MEMVKFNGWDCIRLSNGKVEVLVTRSIGPRVVRYGFVGGPNVFAEIPSQIGGHGESTWMNRGGHRLWIAPEANPWSYELDNDPYAEAVAISGGVHTRQEPGPLTHVEKEMDIVLCPDTGFVRLHHRLTNRGADPVRLSLWTVNACGLDGRAIFPLPEKRPHSPSTLLPNQNWALWTYTDLSDPRWTLGSRFFFLRQDPAAQTPQKLGLRNRQGWMAYERAGTLFVMRFAHLEGAEYPDCNCNCETFTNKEITELETLGPLVTLAPGDCVEQDEEWRLFDGFAPCADEADVLARVAPLAQD